VFLAEDETGGEGDVGCPAIDVHLEGEETLACPCVPQNLESDLILDLTTSMTSLQQSLDSGAVFTQFEVCFIKHINKVY